MSGLAERIATAIVGAPPQAQLGGITGMPARHEAVKHVIYHGLIPGNHETAREIAARLGLNLSSTRSALRQMLAAETAMRGPRTRRGYVWTGRQNGLL